MRFLHEGESIDVQGSGKKPYEVKKVGGVVSCSCPAWRNLGGPIDNRVCKHIKANIDPACLLPQAQAAMGIGNPITGTVANANKPAIPKPTVEPPLLLAHSWTDEDPTGWWISEKMDGVRALWDGEKFVSRLGNVFHAPAWFKDGMPAGVKLDGELFMGRKMFDLTVGAVKKIVPEDAEWKKITFHVFDILDYNKPLEARLDYLSTLWNLQDVVTWQPVAMWPCKDKNHLLAELDKVNAAGGEGLMIRQPGSKYEAGRSNTLLKIKTFHDAEAEVVAHEPGKGKHTGRMGALVCRMADGTMFSVGSGFTDKQRENPPGIGTQITYKYQELTKAGVPRFPTFVSARDYE